MRLDKFLKNSRIIKRRTIAKEACDGGRISVNGKVAKAGTSLSIGDLIEIRFGEKLLKAEVKSLPSVVRKEDAERMYIIV
jgi:ribosomal 50S subunit-recycling heat shock protein